jgi:hypothetical protein
MTLMKFWLTGFHHDGTDKSSPSVIEFVTLAYAFISWHWPLIQGLATRTCRPSHCNILQDFPLFPMMLGFLSFFFFFGVTLL